MRKQLVFAPLQEVKSFRGNVSIKTISKICSLLLLVSILVVPSPAVSALSTENPEHVQDQPKPAGVQPLSAYEPFKKSEYASQYVSSPDLTLQRHLYTEALSAIKKNQFKRYQTLRKRLDGYPLIPYLEYRFLLKHPDQINGDTLSKFTNEYHSARWSNYLRDVYLRALLKRDKRDQFVELYTHNIDDTELACEYIEALHQQGKKRDALDEAEKLWQQPFSMPKACDPMFTRLIEQRGISVEAGRERFRNAYIENEITLAKYLKRFLTTQEKPLGESLLAARKSANNVKTHWPKIQNTIENANDIFWLDALYQAIKPSLKEKSPAGAQFVEQKLKPLKENSRLGKQLYEKSADYIIVREGLNDIRNVPSLYKKLEQPKSITSMEWAARAYINNAQWRKLEAHISTMPEELSGEPRWQYWQLRAKQLAGDLSGEELDEFESIANEANFYGFYAAKTLGKDQKIAPIGKPVDNELVKSLLATSHIARAIEFYFHGALSQANIEWYNGIKTLEHQETLAAAYIAHQVGWHHQAISTAARAKAWQHYAIRFPETQYETFAIQSAKYGVPVDWLYATARQESALNQHARSSAGALGIMQLMPATAKQQAEKLGLRYSNARLEEPTFNIALGSAYITSMFHRFQNKALASAAYNAGPHRVDRWLKTLDNTIPVDAWIETIRYKETRQYVQNVMSFALIFNSMREISGEKTGSAPGHNQNKFVFFDEQEAIVRPYQKQISETVDF